MYTIRILIFSIVLLPNLCWSSSNQTLLTTSRPTEKLSFLSEFHTVYRDRLRTAICENDIAKIQYADPKILTDESDGQMPLLAEIILAGDHESRMPMLQCALSKIDTQKKDPKLLFDAARSGNLYALKELVSKGFDLHIRDEHGKNLLDVMCRFDQRQELARLQSVDNDEIQETEEEKAKKEAMFNYLIRYGLKINYAMLHDAVSRDDITMFKLVWNNYKNGEDYIYTFLRCYPLKDETLDLIFKLDRQNFIDYLDDQFYSIYYCSQFENLSQAAIRYGDLAKIQHFITRAIVIAKTMHGNSYEPEILGYAAQVGRLDAIKLDNNKETKILADLLQTAVRYDQVEATQFLIEFGANKDSVDRDGQTLMHKAVHAYSFKTIRYLLSIGFDVTKRDTFGRTACNCLNERLNFSKIAQKLGEQDYRLPIYKEELTPEQIIPEMIKIEELLKEAERRAYSASSKKV